MYVLKYFKTFVHRNARLEIWKYYKKIASDHIIVAVLDTYLFCIVISKYGSRYLITFFASTSILPPPFLIQLKDKTSSISSKIFSQAKFAAPPQNIGLRLPIWDR